MNIGILGHSAELSGAELSLVRMLAALPDDHPPVRCLWFADGAVVARLRELGFTVDLLPLAGDLEGVSRVEAGRLSPAQLARVGRSAVFAAQVARWVRDQDIDVVHTTTLKTDLVGAAAAFLTRRRLVWHVRDRIAEDYLPARVVRVVQLIARTRVDHVIANSLATGSTLPGVRRLTIAYPGYAPDMARATPRPIPDGPPVVGMVGRISPTKGQLEFVRAAARVLQRHPDATFRIIGSPMFGAEPYAAALGEEIKRLGVGDRVEVVGFVEDTRAELDAMAVCVHASPVPEPFGNVVVEAMIRGVPVVATDAGGVPEILVPDLGGEPLGLLVAPGSVPELAAAIEAVLDDPAAAAARAHRAHGSAVARFPATITAATVTRVWREVLGEPGVPLSSAPVTLLDPAADGDGGTARVTAYQRRPDVGVVAEPGPEGAPVYVARLPEGPIIVLEGSASVIWRAATEMPPDEWVSAVAEALGGTTEQVEPQVQEFVDGLVDQGYLVPLGPPGLTSEEELSEGS